MAHLRVDIAVNFSTKILVGILGLVVVPVYLNYLGSEAYGLIGFYAMLQSLFAMFDLGLAPGLTRALATKSESQSDGMRDLVYSFEMPYWIIAIILGLTVWLASGWIAQTWLNPVLLKTAEVERIIQLAALALALQWPVAFYNAGLSGQGRQVVGNIWLGIMTTLKSVGAIFVLQYVSPTLESFFIWQSIAGFTHTFVLATIFRNGFSTNNRSPQFVGAHLKSLFRYSLGTTGTGFFMTLLFCADRLILINILPLKDFGLYTLATSLTNALLFFALPISTALFPRFSLAEYDKNKLKKLFHQGAQLIGLGLYPSVAVMIFFPDIVLNAWLGPRNDLDLVTQLLVILALAGLLNNSMNIAYTLQSALGRTRVIFIQYGVAVVFGAPLLALAAFKYGAIGVAAVWLCIFFGFIIVALPYILKQTLPGELFNWALSDFILPCGGAFLAVLIVGAFLGVPESRVESFINLLCLWLSAFVMQLLLGNELAEYIKNFLGKAWR